MAGVAKAGMVYVGLNFRLSQQELLSIFENSQPAAVITDGPSRELLEAVNADLGAPLIDLDEKGPHGYEQLLLEASDRPPAALHSVWPDDDFFDALERRQHGEAIGVVELDGAQASLRSK